MYGHPMGMLSLDSIYAGLDETRVAVIRILRVLIISRECNAYPKSPGRTKR